ncbi:hypothetical protein F6476_26690 [Pseudomonas umsongensis]|nr:hypothetical protein F6476_26690 [Pseudomonas umsongensis]
MGAGLLAKAIDQSISVLNDQPLSRASPLPHSTAIDFRPASFPTAPTAPASLSHSTTRSTSC